MFLFLHIVSTESLNIQLWGRLVWRAQDGFAYMSAISAGLARRLSSGTVNQGSYMCPLQHGGLRVVRFLTTLLRASRGSKGTWVAATRLLVS